MYIEYENLDWEICYDRDNGDIWLQHPTTYETVNLEDLPWDLQDSVRYTVKRMYHMDEVEEFYPDGLR